MSNDATIRTDETVECLNCDEWKPNTAQINSGLILAWVHGQRFEFAKMQFCPYCGERLTETPK